MKVTENTVAKPLAAWVNFDQRPHRYIPVAPQHCEALRGPCHRFSRDKSFVLLDVKIRWSLDLDELLRASSVSVRALALITSVFPPKCLLCKSVGESIAKKRPR